MGKLKDREPFCANIQTGAAAIYEDGGVLYACKLSLWMMTLTKVEVTDRQADTQKDRQKEKQIERQADRQTG